LPHSTSSARAFGAAIAAFALCGGIALAQSDVSVTLNGAPLNLNPPPQERSGRVFVPLRGVFEQLGASVVYDNGTINAQKGHERSVSIHVGSTQATVDGQPQTMDVAPFIIGASTYVPLRFVSQALGATVNYDASNRIVALGNGGPQQTAQQAPPREGPPPQNLQAPPPDHTALTLSAVRPNRNEVVTSRRPTIEADFANGRVNPNSLRIVLDGVNVTDQATRSPRGVVFSPPSDLQAGRHEVRVNGTDVNGTPFDAQWAFSTSRTVGER
jgi:copper amine oxidase-like protein